MTNFIVNIYTYASYVSAALIIMLGSLLALVVLVFPAWYLLSKVIYKRVEGSIYFLSYIMNREKFKNWLKENK